MISLRLVRVEEFYMQPRSLQEHLRSREGVSIAGVNFTGSVSREMIYAMKTLGDHQKVIILNQPTLRGQPAQALFPPDSLFAFRSLHKHGGNSTLLKVSEALVEGNYFLCMDGKVESEAVVDDLNEPNKSFERFDTHEYRYYVDIEETRRWRSDRPYVNLDRDSDSIGLSSWDGNLVNWFKCGFSTRIHYARQTGLLPEES